jgi:prepilin signal peptidase PulO-like enzyme (type II secretory pathway)
MEEHMDTIRILMNIVISVAAGLIAGPAVIYTFNRIPAKWLCDYGQEPEPGMWGERIAKKPWTVVFILVFTASSLKMMMLGYLYAIPALVSIWLLLLIGIADRKYMIIPDQLVIALAATAFGFVSYHTSFRTQLLGALIGAGSILLMGIIGSLIFRKETIGFGDVKLFAAAGLLLGIRGAVIAFLLTVFSSALVFSIGMMTGKIKAGEAQPLGPFIAASASLYLLFLPELSALANLYLGI